MCAVVITYSFAYDVPVFLFDDESMAIKALKEAFEEEVRIDRDETEADSDYEIKEDGSYAKIVSHGLTGDQVTEFHLGRVCEGRK